MMKAISYNQHYLPDSVWKRIEPYLPKRIRTSTRGRPACDLRKTIEGILRVLKSGSMQQRRWLQARLVGATFNYRIAVQ